MFTINEDKSISVTRGDIVVFQVTAKKDGKEYTFLEGDILRMRVFGKKNCEKLMMVKDFPVNADTKTVEVFLGEEDTKFGPVISKPTAYWYEIELNPDTYPQTIIGYDEDGPREFLLYPEGKELTEGAMDDRIKGDVQQIIENTVLANLPEIENETWWIGGEDTGKPTRGEQGNPGVYVGSGSMPADCYVQFDPEGEYVFGPPKIVDGTWWTWDEETGDYIDTGVNASGGGGSSVFYRATDYGISTTAEDNTPALQALVDAVSAKGGGIIFFPVGTYNFMRWSSSDYRWAVEMKSNVSIIGENLEHTVLKQTQETPYSLFGRILADGAGAADPLTGCTFKNFTVDAYATGNVNHVCGKAFFFQYVRDCVFRDLRLMGTTATAMGIDFLDRVVIDNVSCIDCGRTFTGNEAGTSGIGIGTAGWENENFIITNCICEGSGQYGIFIENQGIFYEGNVPYAKGCIISNCIVRNGINKGIGVRGGQNVTVIGCESYENASHGIFIDNNCKNVKVISCSAANNGGSGICVTPNSTEHLFVKGCTFVNNQGEGIKVSVEAGRNANKLCIQDCYTDGNTVGMDLSASSLQDCVILGNANLDGVNYNTTFAGNTQFNDLINNTDEPVITSVAVPWSLMTNGKKLMPDGSFTDGTLGSTMATEEFIDVSMLSDPFELCYPLDSTGPIRTAQYDSNKNSLSTSFGLDGETTTDADYRVWRITKLAGCHYIRLFLSGGYHSMDGLLRSTGEAV